MSDSAVLLGGLLVMGACLALLLRASAPNPEVEPAAAIGEALGIGGVGLLAAACVLAWIVGG